jgi:hypothetical protein
MAGVGTSGAGFLRAGRVRRKQTVIARSPKGDEAIHSKGVAP